MVFGVASQAQALAFCKGQNWEETRKENRSVQPAEGFVIVSGEVGKIGISGPHKPFFTKSLGSHNALQLQGTE